jgi:hypothetical protein
MEVTGEGCRAVVLVFDGDVHVATCRMEGSDRPDVSLVDTLARLQLAARRRGCSIRLRDPCEELCALLDLLGLADVIVAESGLVVEAGREAEGGEQLGVEEVVEPGDPTA